MSPCRNTLCTLGLILYLRARLILSSLSALMNACRANLIASSCIFTRSSFSRSSSAGGLSCKTFGNFGFCPNVNCAGEKPCTFANPFFAWIAHGNTNSSGIAFSAPILSSIDFNVALCLSTRPLLHGLSALVFITRIFIASAICISCSFANSRPLSLRNFSGAPKMVIQHS